MTAHINPTSTTQPALFNSPTLEFVMCLHALHDAPPTRENLTAIARLGDVAARVRFSIQARGVERFKPNPRGRRESTRPVEGTLELTVRVVGREQAPIVMTERTIYNTLEIYRRFENQLFKLEVERAKRQVKSAIS
jgi:hypothetical protein